MKNKAPFFVVQGICWGMKRQFCGDSFINYEIWIHIKQPKKAFLACAQGTLKIKTREQGVYLNPSDQHPIATGVHFLIMAFGSVPRWRGRAIPAFFLGHDRSCEIRLPAGNAHSIVAHAILNDLAATKYGPLYSGADVCRFGLIILWLANMVSVSANAWHVGAIWKAYFYVAEMQPNNWWSGLNFKNFSKLSLLMIVFCWVLEIYEYYTLENYGTFTWNLKITKITFQTSIFGSHVHFPGCSYANPWSTKTFVCCSWQSLSWGTIRTKCQITCIYLHESPISFPVW